MSSESEKTGVPAAAPGRRQVLIGLTLLAGGCTQVNRYGLGADDPFPFWTGKRQIPGIEPDPASAAQRRVVSYAGGYPAGTIVVNVGTRELHYVTGGGKAIFYPVGVGREGLSFRGNAVVGRKQEWPGWHPTPEMIRSDPKRYRPYQAGMPGGPDNPLGARALYLYQNGRDTLFRIHGTNQPASIGTASSAGCIRMLNDDVIDLYNRVQLGAPVTVLDI